jgi:uncharacterized Zn-binding protein involved in type VI secretion
MPGVARLGDKAKAKLDAHGCPGCPHPDVQGPGIVCSSNVFINGIGALNTTSVGIHSACCGPNMWKMTAASGAVFVNGAPMVRKGDPTLHCGTSPGEIVDSSANVQDGSPQQILLQEAAKTFATGGFEAMKAVIEHNSAAVGGALTAAKWLGRGGVVAGGTIEVLPAAVKGDVQGVARGVVSTAAGAVAGGAAAGACTASTLGLGAPVCVGAGIVVGGVVSWGSGKAFDAGVSLVGKIF